MAEKNQPGISQKIKTLCDEYSSRSMILNENNGKTLISSVGQNLSKANQPPTFKSDLEQETSYTIFTILLKEIPTESNF